MRTVTHQEFNRHFCRIPGHVRPVQPPGSGTIEFFYGGVLVGVLVRPNPKLGKPALRLVPENLFPARP